MNIRIYNSLTNKIEDFKPIKENEVSMYVCGPTVYNYPHIGNARPVVFFDTVARLFKYLGYKVTYVSNFTDIDDKIIKRASEEHVLSSDIAEKYIKAFKDTLHNLGCLDPDYNPRVTETIPEIIAFIEELKKAGFAYQVGDNVYFSVNKVPNYGILSNQKLEELEVGARIEVEQGKKDPRDFVLWKLTTDDGPKWDSPFGKGRPGWHTECCVMIDEYFKGMIDIHGGGNDLKFPHHENEIAQAEALHQNTIANYWIHNARIDLKGEKMSKSLGNVIWTKDLISEYGGMAVRFLIISNHYRQTISYSEELMNQVVNELNKIERCYISLYRILDLANELDLATTLPLESYIDPFLKEMVNDFSTPNALTVLFSFMKDINIKLRMQDKDFSLLKSFLKTFDDMLYVLGLNFNLKPLTKEEKELVEAWQEARKNKNFSLADELRVKITEKGIKF